MSEYKKKAFDAALDLVKQLITLSTGVLALSGTFIKEFAGMLHGRAAEAVVKLNHPCLLFTGWGLLLFSIFLGLLAHGAIVGVMDSIADDNSPANTAFAPNIRVLATAQWISFLAGIVVMIIFCGREV